MNYPAIDSLENSPLKTIPLLTLLLLLGLSVAEWALPLPAVQARGGAGNAYSGGHSSPGGSSGGGGLSIGAGTSAFHGYSSTYSRSYDYDISDPRVVKAINLGIWGITIGIVVLCLWKQKKPGESSSTPTSAIPSEETAAPTAAPDSPEAK